MQNFYFKFCLRDQLVKSLPFKELAYRNPVGLGWKRLSYFSVAQLVSAAYSALIFIV
jgi:hypothetical protein